MKTEDIVMLKNRFEIAKQIRIKYSGRYFLRSNFGYMIYNEFRYREDGYTVYGSRVHLAIEILIESGVIIKQEHISTKKVDGWITDVKYTLN